MHLGTSIAQVGIAPVAKLRPHDTFRITITSKGTPVKIVFEEDASLNDVEVSVRAPRLSDEVVGIISSLKLHDFKLTGFSDGAARIVPATRVLYFESVDKKTFFYTAEGVFETQMRLYEIEDGLASCGFVRTGKSVVLNLKEVSSLRSEIGGRMLATLSNGERTVISRAYAPRIRKLLGL